MCIPSGISSVSWRTEHLVSGPMASDAVGVLYEQLQEHGDGLSQQHEFICPLQWQCLHSLPKTCRGVPVPSYTHAWLTAYFHTWVDTGKSAFWLERCTLRHDDVSGVVVAEPLVCDDTHACMFLPNVFSEGYTGKTDVSETFQSYCS